MLVMMTMIMRLNMMVISIIQDGEVIQNVEKKEKN